MGDSDNPVTHIVSQTDSAAKELTDPVINHAERITRLEGDLGHLGEKMTNDLFETERRLNEAISQGAGQEQIAGLRERISALEGTITALAERVTRPVAEGAGEEARTVIDVPAELTSDVVGGGEQVSEKKEREKPRGIHRRRKARRQKS